MIHSFLNTFLPSDEYKRIKIVYIMAEASFLTTGILIIFSLININWLKWESDGSLIIFLIFSFILFYTFLRYIFSGIEHTNVYNKNDYSKQRRKSLKSSLRFGVIFFVASFVIKGIPSDLVNAMDIIGPSILAVIFYYLFDYISLKRSFKKNQELLDD